MTKMYDIKNVKISHFSIISLRQNCHQAAFREGAMTKRPRYFH